jgi:two-component system NtrC family sensor kinase
VAHVNAEQQRLIARLQEKNRIISRQADEIRSAQQRLIETARMAGMAEIATSVLHNVGNLLNTSVTATAIMRESLGSSKMSTLARLSTLLHQHREDFGRFINQDSRGGKLPEFIQQIHTALSQEQDLLREKLSTLNESTEQIRQIIALQHRYIGAAGIKDKVSLRDLIQDATRLSLESLKRHDIKVVQELADDIPEVCIEKHKVLQILMNLLKNAQEATKSMSERQRQIRVRLTACPESMAQIEIADNGLGIKREHLDRIFNFGFTTKSDGHGFGLHSCANMAREMGGTLTATSAGEGQGASFSLKLPLSN